MKYILLDLDGTLLPMDQELFTKAYFKYLTTTLATHGYDKAHLVDAIWQGTAKMIKNDGTRTNEQVFWESFASIYGKKAYDDEPLFYHFYQTEFNKAQSVCGFNPKVKDVITKLKQAGFKLILASNPIFPKIAQIARVKWAGLKEDDFELYTSYENMSYCKPNPKYYEAILQKTGCKASDCLMVGNDALEDMIAKTTGMDVFLVTDCLINQKNLDITSYPKGNFDDLLNYIKTKHLS